MSIEKIHNTYNLICDCCGESPDEIFGDFYEVADYKKANDWKSRRWGDIWQDVCPDCQGKED